MGAVLTSVLYESHRPQVPPFSNSASLHVLVDSLPNLLYTSIGIINNGHPKCPNPFSSLIHGRSWKPYSLWYPNSYDLAPGAVQCVALDVDKCRLYFDNGYDDGVDG